MLTVKHLAILLFLTLPMLASAQSETNFSQQRERTLVLHSGEQLTGTILKETATGVEIQLTNGNIRFVELAEIKMMRLATKKTAANQKKAEKPAAKNFAADSSQGEKRNPPKENRIARLRNLVPDKQVGQTTSSFGVSVLSAAYLNYDKKDFFLLGYASSSSLFGNYAPFQSNGGFTIAAKTAGNNTLRHFVAFSGDYTSGFRVISLGYYGRYDNGGLMRIDAGVGLGRHNTNNLVAGTRRVYSGYPYYQYLREEYTTTDTEWAARYTINAEIRLLYGFVVEGDFASSFMEKQDVQFIRAISGLRKNFQHAYLRAGVQWFGFEVDGYRKQVSQKPILEFGFRF